jgi:alginate O-acetyltransferase complex protein AlgJ
MNAKKFSELLIITAFFAIICLPTTSLVCGFKPSAAIDEKRTLAKFPRWKWEWNSMKEYHSKMMDYYSDHYGFRPQLIRTYNIIMTRYVKNVSRNNVLFGKNNWLYWSGGDAFDQYRSAAPLTEKDLQRMARILEERQSFCERMGARYFFVIVPDKHSIYPEFLPEWMTKTTAKSHVDQLVEYLRAHTSVEVIDLREPLLAAKKSYQVYFQTDTHWNEVGGFFGYRAIMERISHWFPRLRAAEITDFEQKTITVTGGDLALLAGLKDQYNLPAITLVPKRPPTARKNLDIGTFYVENFPKLVLNEQNKMMDFGIFAMETGRNDLPRGVVFRDSFASYFIPYLSEHFSRIIFYWVIHESEKFDFQSIVVRHERPAIVINEMAERTVVQMHDNTDEVKASLRDVKASLRK